MSKTTIRLSEFTLEQLKQIARGRDISVSQLINEISLQYIGAREGAHMMQERADRGSKAKARKALAKVRKVDLPPMPEDRIS